MPKTDLPRIAIIGAGPIGLEAALYAATLKHPVHIFERGQIADYWRHWGHVRLFSPFRMNSTALGRAAITQNNAKHELPADDACLTGREHVQAYLEPLAQTPLVKAALHVDARVVQMGRRGFLKLEYPGDAKRAKEPFRLLIRDAKNKERMEEADIVLDCSGTYGMHRWLGDGGIPAAGETAAEAQIAYGLDDVRERKNVYAGKSVLVVGAGYSAATTVSNLAALAEADVAMWVTWLSRNAGTQPLKRIANDPLKERDRLAARANTLATRNDGNVEFHPQSVIDAIETAGPDKGFVVRGRMAGKPRTWEVDRIIANVGYSPDNSIYRELQVHECYASLGPMKLAAALAGQKGQDCLQQTCQGAETLRNPEPNFFILGTKSYGRNSNFLLRLGFEQIREVFTLISGNKELDLYKTGKR